MIHLVELDEQGNIQFKNGLPHPNLGTANDVYDATPGDSLKYMLKLLHSEPVGGRRLAVVRAETKYNILERANFTPVPVQSC